MEGISLCEGTRMNLDMLGKLGELLAQAGEEGKGG
jgi:hypothetical protein